jgi:hypothetical protein
MSKHHVPSDQAPNSAETLFANGIIGSNSSESSKGSMVGNPEGNMGGMSMAFHGVIPSGEIDSVIPGLKTGGIVLLTECGIDEDLFKSIFGEGALNANFFAVFDNGNLSIFGLTKSESFAIKSLSTFMSLQHLTLKAQGGLDLKNNTSIIGGPTPGG